MKQREYFEKMAEAYHFVITNNMWVMFQLACARQIEIDARICEMTTDPDYHGALHANNIREQEET